MNFPNPTSNQKVKLTVIMVSYNTRELTLKSLETLYLNTELKDFKTVVFDNASADGSADAIEKKFPQVELIRSNENLGFAKANNIVAEQADSDWLLLLNPDTEVHQNAIDELLTFSEHHPEAGITGGRTVFPDGSLNIASCWKKITLWSTFCHAVGLSTLLPNSNFFNTEAMIDWKRDSVREVDIVVGCFLMVPTALWRKLDGFNLKYIMYGEEADLCLRATKVGYTPMITPNAQIMHLVGASSFKRAEKLKLVAKSRITLIKDHWNAGAKPIGVFLMWIWGFSRYCAVKLAVPKSKQSYVIWTEMWNSRKEWIDGYKS